jgi:hypothetical protein
MLAKVKARKFFYRDHYRKALTLLLLLLMVAAILIVAIIYEVLTPDARQYYATATNGDLFSLQVTSAPKK